MSTRKRYFTLPAGILLLGLLASCGTTDSTVESMESAGAGFPAGSAGWSENEREIYRASFDAGRRDQQEGYRFEDDRVALPLKQELRSFARQGYRSGYYFDASSRRAARAAAANRESSADSLTRPAASSPSPPLPELPRPPAKPQGPDPLSVPLEPVPLEPSLLPVENENLER